MPALITHYIFAQTALSKSDENVQKIVKKHETAYNVGAQGPDVFFYYLPGHFRSSTRWLGLKMHKENVNVFINALIDATLKIGGEEEYEIAFSYLCGYLSHYSLDANTHPYIYYKTGFRRKGDMMNAPKYSMYHRKFETAVDSILLKTLSTEKSSERKMHQMIKVDPQNADVISKILSEALYNAYNVQVPPNQLKSALKYMSFTTAMLDSKTGRRKKMMELVEDLTLGEHLFSVKMDDINESLDYLNMNKSQWNTPWDNEEKRSETFIELFNNGVNETVGMMEKLYDYTEELVSQEELSETIGNRSLASGRDCSEELDWKHSEIIFEGLKNRA